MKKTAFTVLLGFCLSAPATAARLNPSDVQKVRLPKGARIVMIHEPKPVRPAAKPVRRSAAPAAKPVSRRAGKFPVYLSNAALDSRVPVYLRPLIHEAAQSHGIDPRLLAAVARRESRFRTRAVSPVGAQGLMQLMPRTAKWLGVRDSFDPRQNLFGGAKYLRMLLDDYRGNLDLTLAAYNAGPGAVKKYGGIPPYRETRDYVAAIRTDYAASIR